MKISAPRFLFRAAAARVRLAGVAGLALAIFLVGDLDVLAAASAPMASAETSQPKPAKGLNFVTLPTEAMELGAATAGTDLSAGIPSQKEQALLRVLPCYVDSGISLGKGQFTAGSYFNSYYLLFTQNGKNTGFVILRSDSTNTSFGVSGLELGPTAVTTAKALQDLGGRSEIQADAFEVRLLRTNSPGARYLWLKSLSGGSDLICVISDGYVGVKALTKVFAGSIYTLEDFLKICVADTAKSEQTSVKSNFNPAPASQEKPAASRGTVNDSGR